MMSYLDRLTTACLRAFYDQASQASPQLRPPIEPYLRRAASLASIHGWAWGFAIGWVLGSLGSALYWYMQ